MKFATIMMLLLAASLGEAQLTVTGSSPMNGAVGVNTNSTLSITFSAPVDTVTFLPDNSFLSNVDSVTGMYWSADSRTVYFPAVLNPDAVYFIVIYHAAALGGGTLQAPYEAHFTTASAFPSNVYTVSGTVMGGATGVSPANALVAMTDGGLAAGGDKGPKFVAATFADAGGGFAVPYVPIGSWDPVAAKDANGDGQIDPSLGDAIGTGSTVSVVNANVSGVTLTFQIFPPIPFRDARDSAVTRAGLELPGTRELRKVSSWNLDSLGRASEWEFYYSVPGQVEITRIRPGMFGLEVRSSATEWDWVLWSKPTPDVMQAALADSFIANVERNGGKAFRLAKPAGDNIVFRAQAELGDLHNGWYGQMITDTSQFYWGARYSYEIPVTPDSSVTVAHKLFLGTYAAGTLLSVTGVDEAQDLSIPERIVLAQNYPNPFNPSTEIEFGVPSSGLVTLKVYNLLGQEVAVLVNGWITSGWHRARFDGSGVASGLYFCRLEAGKQVSTRKMLLTK